MKQNEYDVIVVGAGNAAFCAAIAAREQGATVLVIDCAPPQTTGGNTRFTAGAIRFAYQGVEDLIKIMPDLTKDEIDRTDFGSYTEDDFFEDMFRLTQYRSDPTLCELLIRNSFATVQWMQQNGVRFNPIYGRQAFLVDGQFKFWGGLTVEAYGGGEGLIAALTDSATRAGIEIAYSTRAVSLSHTSTGVNGLTVKSASKVQNLQAGAVVLACGGFQSSPEMRTRYLGPGWDLAKVRGTAFNTGDGHKMAIAIGASTHGNWSGCHAVGWDMNAPEFGDLAIGDGFQKHSYPFGVMVNANGERFVDEGADFRNYTYAKYGREILAQPGQFAWQIFDAQVAHLLRDEYRIKQVTKVQAESLEALAQQLEGVNPQAFLQTITEYNQAVNQTVAFSPNVKDGRATMGLAVEKSNWANTISEPPFQAYGITCGVTFTFGGLRIDGSAQVQSVDLTGMRGLYAAGEIVGGLFYHNYPGGTGLMNGAVFGKIAGENAALHALAR